ncbi:MAG: hypothetical protein JXA90_02555 [Planctomycetes bacterium]|nr:hypothetical protein [Planctomycetota bacterium]
MSKKTDIHAVEVVRRIRDEHAELLRGKSDEEIIEFFREAANAFRTQARTRSRGAANQRIQPPARKAPRG